MDALKIMALHSLSVGSRATLDGEDYTVVYRDSYLNEVVTVLENFGKSRGGLAIARDENLHIYSKYDKNTKPFQDYTVPQKEIFKDGADTLGNSMEHADFEKIRRLLPPYNDDAYIALGHPSGERTATVDLRGRMFSQRIEYRTLRQLVEEVVAYDPSVVFGELGAAKPYQSFLDGKYPILYNVHETDELILEGLYILETGNYRSGSAAYVRSVVTDKRTGQKLSEDYRIVGIDCVADYDADDTAISAALFYDCLLNIIDYFESFEKNNSRVELPIKELERSYIGTMFTLDGLFSAERMRYGHRIYGTTYHDFFPPNFIVALLAYSMNGQTLKAGRIAQYVLANVIDNRGRVLYRQGDGQNYGFSASELGQFLWVLSRYEGIYEPAGCLRPYASKILAMGNFLLSKICESDEISGVSLIRTCAEADTNERVHDYLENTLWGIRGLEAVCRLGEVLNVDTQIYYEAAQKLRSDMQTVYKATEVDSPFGKLVPFRLGYSATPLTLAPCRTTAYPVSDEEYERYIKISHVRSDEGTENEQDLIENCYANYRYYPEMLSSCMLDAEYERAILRMREALGGEFLGMIRWFNGADDWPAYNLAINYMERGETEKFLKLLYAHAAHHGLLDFHIYYEQITLGEEKFRIKADTSVPCIMLGNLMINMMFCYESVNGSEIELLKAIPAEWVGKEEISIHNACTSKGRLSLIASMDAVKLSFDGEFGEVRLWLNGFERERLERIAGLNDNVRCDGDSLIISNAVGERLILLA